jgi:hypothetical protein
MTSRCERCDCEMHPADAAISEICRKCVRSMRGNRIRYLTAYGKSTLRAWRRHADAARCAHFRHGESYGLAGTDEPISPDENSKFAADEPNAGADIDALQRAAELDALRDDYEIEQDDFDDQVIQLERDERGDGWDDIDGE